MLTTGNENDLIYPRSSIKIFQAIPFIQSKSQKYYKFNSKKIALACSSHRGENFHINELEDWIYKVKISKAKLKCGIHNPLNPKASENLFRLNKIANQLHNNCAGKHLAMLTTCLFKKYSINDYLDFNHQHQKDIRKIFEKFSNKKIYKYNYGIDGCSAPQYSFKIKNLARMLINLFKSYNEEFDYSYEVKYLIKSIVSNPKYIGGSDSLDSRIMIISNKQIFCKGGAEGVFLFICLKKGIVGVVKVVDGNERAIPNIVYKLFKKFNIMTKKELEELNKNFKFDLINHAKTKVGSVISNI